LDFFEQLPPVLLLGCGLAQRQHQHSTNRIASIIIAVIVAVVVVVCARSCAEYFDKAAKPVLRIIDAASTAAALGFGLGWCLGSLGSGGGNALSIRLFFFGTRDSWSLVPLSFLSGNLLAFIFLIDSSYLVLGKF
jgi:hypothetical protein